MPDQLSTNVAYLKASETVAISNEAKRRKAAGENVLDLGVGEPDFDVPAPAAQAGIQAIQRGMTRYPPNAGILDLRAAIAKNLSLLSGGRPVNPDNILISSGSKQSIFNACFCLFGPKDKEGSPLPPGNSCVRCHIDHGAFNGTFAQFYPTIRPHLPKELLERASKVQDIR